MVSKIFSTLASIALVAAGPVSLRAVVPHDSLNPVTQRVQTGAIGDAIAKFNPLLHIANGCQPYTAPVLSPIFPGNATTLGATALLPPGNKVDIGARRINGTTVTSQTLVDLHIAHDRADWHLLNHAFHPFN
ncbi:hypothetical protein VD0001_g1892, partial [Verticillium dahliae]